MPRLHPRITRERVTVEAMIRIHCHDRHHTTTGLCSDCLALQEYALQRLVNCPFQDGKTTCAKCPVHCFRPAMRERIKAVMRYAGPRMLYRHPLMTVQHIIDGRRNEPIRTHANAAPRGNDATIQPCVPEQQERI
jgi:hypothetical protein